MPILSARSGWAGVSVRTQARATLLAASWRSRIDVVTAFLSGRPVVLGFLGSVLLGIGALGIGSLPKPDALRPRPALYAVRDSLLGRSLLTASALLGVALLLSAWLALGRLLAATEGPSLGRLRAVVALWSAPLLLVPPIFSRDLYSYAAQAHLLRTGHDPYQVGPWVEPGNFADSVDPLWSATKTPYGPVFLWLGHLVSQVTGESVYGTVIGMRLLAVAGLVLLVFALPRLAVRCGVDPRRATWLALLNPLVPMHFVGGGHNDALMIGLVVAALCLALEGHPLLGSVVVAVGAGVKAPAAFAIIFVGHIWARRLDGRSALLRGLTAAGAVALTAFAAITAATGLGYGWLGALSTPATVRTWLSPPTAVGMLTGLVGRMLGFGNHTYELVGQSRFLFGGLAVLLIAIVAVWPRGLQPVRGTALALLALVVLGPVVQPWYLMWALLLFAAGGLRERETPYAVWGVTAAVVVSQLNGSVLTGGLVVVGFPVCLWLTFRIVSGSWLLGPAGDELWQPVDDAREAWAQPAQPYASQAPLPALVRPLP